MSPAGRERDGATISHSDSVERAFRRDDREAVRESGHDARAARTDAVRVRLQREIAGREVAREASRARAYRWRESGLPDAGYLRAATLRASSRSRGPTGGTAQPDPSFKSRRSSRLPSVSVMR